MTFFKKKETPTPTKNIQEVRYQTNLLAPLVLVAIVLIACIMAYGFFVAPCSFEVQGKATGKFEMQNPLVSNQSVVINSFEGKLSGSAPCVAVLSLGFNQKVSSAPETRPKSVPRLSSLEAN